MAGAHGGRRPGPGRGAPPAETLAAADGHPAGEPAQVPRGREFDRRVYAVVALIPAGQLATYGQIAEVIGAWGCARQVGWALRRLPLPSAIPWHRVVNAAGHIAMTPSRQGSDWIQRDLLLAEGIAVDGHGRLPLARHRWSPPLSLVSPRQDGG